MGHRRCEQQCTYLEFPAAEDYAKVFSVNDNWVISIDDGCSLSMSHILEFVGLNSQNMF